uniref:Small RNA binding exonuclease protection factor La n=1 Tax=Eptatretus burgeri TaxID=7764 RepID=A0A8C4N5L1_EPTBU
MEEEKVHDEVTVEEKKILSDLEKKIINQVEFYFGDHNLPRDKFLRSEVQKNDGWVPLGVMIRFNRLKSLSSDLTAIAAALQKSSNGLLEISEDGTCVRRLPSRTLPTNDEAYRESIKNRSVYVKGFPGDATLDEVKEWFDERGSVEVVHMRRTFQKMFKGSAFAVFDTAENANNFVALPALKFKDADIIASKKEQYFAKKKEQRRQWRAEERLKQEAESAKNDENDFLKLQFQENCLLKFSGELDAETTREDLHDLFGEHGDIQWISFTRGAIEGFIRFASGAKEVLKAATEANDGELKLKGCTVVWELLEGENAQNMWQKLITEQQDMWNKVRSWTRGRRGGKGGKKFEGGRKRNQNQFKGKKTKYGDDGVAVHEDGGAEEESTDADVPLVKRQKVE